jgi:SMC interacting uncharacterized protein involved in chromosome segregation
VRTRSYRVIATRAGRHPRLQDFSNIREIAIQKQINALNAKAQDLKKQAAAKGINIKDVKVKVPGQ